MPMKYNLTPRKRRKKRAKKDELQPEDCNSIGF
jgi:hypothetical protein